MDHLSHHSRTDDADSEGLFMFCHKEGLMFSMGIAQELGGVNHSMKCERRWSLGIGLIFSSSRAIHKNSDQNDHAGGQ
jgi:hypothetical protein